MSPLVQRPRTAPVRPTSADADQHWTMLLFESMSAGVFVIFAGFVVVLAVVGVYVVIIWPLTFWDLANLGLQRYGSWVSTVLWSLFAGGTLAGYWCFSGNAFKSKSKARIATRPTPTKR